MTTANDDRGGLPAPEDTLAALRAALSAARAVLDGRFYLAETFDENAEAVVRQIDAALATPAASVAPPDGEAVLTVDALTVLRRTIQHYEEQAKQATFSGALRRDLAADATALRSIERALATPAAPVAPPDGEAKRSCACGHDAHANVGRGPCCTPFCSCAAFTLATPRADDGFDELTDAHKTLDGFGVGRERGDSVSARITIMHDAYEHRLRALLATPRADDGAARREDAARLEWCAKRLADFDRSLEGKPVVRIYDTSGEVEFVRATFREAIDAAREHDAARQRASGADVCANCAHKDSEHNQFGECRSRFCSCVLYEPCDLGAGEGGTENA